MDPKMKQLQEALVDIEIDAEQLLLSRHQLVENDKIRNANREALMALRKRAWTTKTSVSSPFEVIMKEMEGISGKPLVKEICSTCGNHDPKEDQERLDYDKKLQSFVKEKSFVISEKGKGDLGVGGGRSVEGDGRKGFLEVRTTRRRESRGGEARAVCDELGGAAAMELPWLDLPFTLLTLLLATRLAYDYYGVVAATFTGSFSLQIFLFYCFARWYRHTIAARAAGDGAGALAGPVPPTEDAPPVLTPLLEAGGGGGAARTGAASSSLANRCFAAVFMVFVPLVIVVFERSQADVLAYALCLANIIVMVVWLSPEAAANSVSAATKSFLRLSDNEDEGSGSGGAHEDKCCVCLAAMREGQALRDLPRCGHRFHAKCIGKWLTAHPTCPVCRATAVPPPAAAADPADDAISPV